MPFAFDPTTHAMISTRLPTAKEIDHLLVELSTAEFSYPHVGATRESMPTGYNVDRYSAIIGRGAADFERAKRGIQDWAPFDQSWVRAFPQSEPAAGTLVAVVARVFGLWWTNLSRVIYTIDESDRFGFAYGTLPLHSETGEERFEVEHSQDSDEVSYRIVAFSKPRHPLARLGYPLSRAVQRRFGVGSIEAMRRATSAYRENLGEDDRVS